MTNLKIGSLFSGVGGLDLAVESFSALGVLWPRSLESIEVAG